MQVKQGVLRPFRIKLDFILNIHIKQSNWPVRCIGTRLRLRLLSTEPLYSPGKEWDSLMMKIRLLAAIFMIGVCSYAQSNCVTSARFVPMNAELECAGQKPVPEAEKKKKSNPEKQTSPKNAQPNPKSSPTPVPSKPKRG